ncbi:hypothetical protein ACFOZY_06335 [Chungangia koreensis]|uniref:Uncharacterized protein n=1 Tax=Chungangia koreensis TaxID=752657 RepID=A0ABV8X4J2_9LACT
MYDPTVFDNLKVAFENHVYDLDTLDRKIDITNRIDRMDFAVMKREFAISFALAGEHEVTAEIGLEASLRELAAEILEYPDATPGCQLTLRFHKRLTNVEEQCRRINQTLNAIWEDEHEIIQIISYFWGQERDPYIDTIEVKFNRTLTEEQMGEIHGFIDHVLKSLESLAEI